MKKLFFLFLCSVLLLTSVSCGKNFGSTKMQLEKAELTKEEQEIVNLLGSGNSVEIFDYQLDDSGYSINVNLLQLQDGKWAKNGGVTSMADNCGRIAIFYMSDKKSFKVSVQDNEGVSSWSTELGSLSSNDSTSRGNSWEGGPVEIVPEQEIPIGIICENSDRDMTMYGVNSFDEPEKFAEQDAAYAVTVVFSKEKLQ